MRGSIRSLLLAAASLALSVPALAGQAPGAADAPDIAISARDRVYTGDQFSNTVSVIDPARNVTLGVIRLGDPEPGNLSPLYRGQLLTHGLGFSPDGRTLVVVSIGSNAVSFVDTATNRVRHTTYVGRAPHEAFFSRDGREVWVSVRGEDYIQILDGTSGEPVARVPTPLGPGMTIFSPDGRYAYVCSSFTPETTVVETATRAVVGRVAQPSPFCPNIAASPDGRQVWFTLKDSGRVVAFSATPPFNVLRVIDTGPLTNHVNFVHADSGSGDGRQLAFVTIGGENRVDVFDTADFARVASIPVGATPHGVWPSGDGARVYVGIENEGAVMAIDTATMRVIGRMAIGQAPQAVVYVPRAVLEDADPAQNLAPPGLAASTATLSLGAGDRALTSVALFDQGLTQVVQAVISGLQPGQAYALALAEHRDGSGARDALARFTANPAGAAVVNAVGPIRQVVRGEAAATRRYLAIVPIDAAGALGAPVQVQRDGS
jgi:YVTN family beta-propeller protein